MAGYVHCECCNLPVPVTSADIGLTVICPRTRKLVAVRKVNGPPTTAKPTKPPLAPQSGPSKTAPNRIEMTCPNCGNVGEVPCADATKSIFCPSCSSVITRQPAVTSRPVSGGPQPLVARPQHEPAQPALDAEEYERPNSYRGKLAMVLAAAVPAVALLFGLGYFVVKEKRSHRGEQEVVRQTGADPSQSRSTQTDAIPPAKANPDPDKPADSPRTSVGVAPTPAVPGSPDRTVASTPPTTASVSTPSAPTTSTPTASATNPPELAPDSLNQLTATYRQEVVRVNHLRNCVLCHIPSFQQTDLVRAAVPDPSQPVPPPNTPEYYSRGGQFIAANTTYLKQDFSVVQPVPDAGKWSTHQRFDYFVTIRKVESPPKATPTANSAYRRAVGVALRELSGRDPDRDTEWLAQQQRLAGSAAENRLTEVARSVSLVTNPNAYLHLKVREYNEPFLRLPNEKLNQTVQELQSNYGETAARTALIAYLQPFTDAEDEDIRGRATLLLAVALSNTSDADLPQAMQTADTRPISLPNRPMRPVLAESLKAPRFDERLAGTKKDSRGLPVFSITKRIDKRTTDELEKELLAVPEVSLDGASGGTGSADLIKHAERGFNNRQNYPGSALACEGRSDLAGLPFRLGLDAMLTLDKAASLNKLSQQLRADIQSCIRDRRDPRPDVELLYQLLSSPRGILAPSILGPSRGSSPSDKTWLTAEAVPCIQQLLQAENRDIRRICVELLQRVDAAEATRALVQWAVFDTDAANRAAAVAALRSRDRTEVVRLLLQAIRYPWPRACEHAAEALIALDCTEAIPQLAAIYHLPDPDAPFRVASLKKPVSSSIKKPENSSVSKPATETTLETSPAPRLRLKELGLQVMASKVLDEPTRRKAAITLGTFLDHPDVSVRRTASQAIAEMGAAAEPASAAMRQALNDPDEDVRRWAAKALDELAEIAAIRRAKEVRHALNELLPKLQAKEPETRIKALLKIAEFGPDASAAGEQIINAMLDKESAVRQAASNTLAKVAPKVHGPVQAILSANNAREAIQQLSDLGPEAANAIPLLLQCNANPALWKDGADKRKSTYEDLFPVIAKIAPHDQRFAAAVLAAVSTPNPRAERNLSERRRAGLAQLNVIQATPADKVTA